MKIIFLWISYFLFGPKKVHIKNKTDEASINFPTQKKYKEQKNKSLIDVCMKIR